MSETERYSIHEAGTMIKNKHGDYVKYKDFTDLTQKLAEARKTSIKCLKQTSELQAKLAEYKDALAEKFNDVCKTCMDVFFPKLQAKNKRLRDALEKIADINQCGCGDDMRDLAEQVLKENKNAP